MPTKTAVKDFDLPADKELLDFQKTGVEEILFRNNVLLGDEMGLGKTIQVLVGINIEKPKKVLVVCPKSLTWNWYNESHNWYTEERKEWAGLDEETTVGTLSYTDQHKNFLIVSYEVIARHYPILATVPWDWVVFDEFHYVKNVSTKRYKGVVKFLELQRKHQIGAGLLEIKSHEPKIIGVTGTPIVNYIDELFPLINILDRKTWYSAARFEREHVVRGARGLRSYVRNAAKLQQILRDTIMIRRMKKDVLTDLPAKRRQVIEFPSEGMEELLAEEMKIFEGRKSKLTSKDATALLDMVTEEIMAINASGAVEGERQWEGIIEDLKFNKKYFFEEMARVRHLVARAKLPFVLDHITEVLDSHENGEKLVIFGHHRDILQEIAEHVRWYYDGKEESCALLMGGMRNDYENQAVITAFQNSEYPKVIVGGLKVIGHGFTMTKASHCIFAELDWVPGTITQAEDRLHRIGQQEKILIQHLVIKNSLDSMMAKKIIRKQREQDKALNSKEPEKAIKILQCTKCGYKTENVETSGWTHATLHSACPSCTLSILIYNRMLQK